ncbi:virion structural protein [Cellulophaga phage phi14:2]|uniref:Structural protein n=1 Tax=Cellulophaga phage phi14:2 TaxID=1327990 RepID=S0A2C8_9CAUD|nr:virion structural protein [Cellulophaga phage phi14:2]AGO48960.1 structural protein [Cellulophaga phage phi14:2]
MLKQIQYTFRGGNQDATKSKHSAEYFYDASHIKILSTDSQSTGSVANEKGNELIFTIPNLSISNNAISYNSKSLVFSSSSDLQTQRSSGEIPSSSNSQIIIGHSVTRNSILFFTTDDKGFDCIWELEDVLNKTYNLNLLYVRNMGFSSDNLIQSIFNYENENIQKTYWVDGINQIRFLNIKSDDIINTPLNTLNFVGDFSLSQPTIDSISSGGSHKAGMVQYAYNLYRLNSSQTKLSPLSELVPLTRGDGLGGGEVNELVSTTPVLKISNVDTQYTNIKIYAVRYTSLNVTPSIELITEKELDGTGNDVYVYDDGSNIGSVSLEEFLFLGSDPIIPKHIATKDNVLFPVNITEQNFDIPEELDCRAYSFVKNSTNSTVLDNPGPNQTSYTINSTYTLAPTIDAVNKDYDLYRYLRSTSIEGGEGKYLSFKIRRGSLTDVEDLRLFKDREIYRYGIEFYNNLGQTSLPKWIADYKMPSGNLEGLYSYLEVTLKPSFYTWLNTYNFEKESDKPVGYRIIRAERTISDRTILCQGGLSGMIFQVKGDEAKNFSQFTNINTRSTYQDKYTKIPSYLIREFTKLPSTNLNDHNGVLQKNNHLGWLNDKISNSTEEGGEIYSVTNNNSKLSQTFQFTKMMQLSSPELLFDSITSVPSGLSLRVVGLAKSTLNGVYASETYIETKLSNNYGKLVGGINPYRVNPPYLEDNNFQAVFKTPEGSSGNNDRRFIGPSGSNSTMDFYHYYRQFNNFVANDNVNKTYNIYGSPELSVRGNDSKLYNEDGRYSYTNSLKSFASDGEDDCDECGAITSINSFGAQNATLMLGSFTDTTDSRTGLEDLHDESTVTDTNGILISELVKSDDFIYTGSLYGGNSYESKKRTNYIKIGEYKDINTNSVTITNGGDTYVQSFKFLRIGKTDTEIYDKDQLQISEIVEFKVETTIDLKNRYDISLNSWDSRIQPQYNDYHGYNSVYSQEPNLIMSTNLDYNFKAVNNFDTRITATKSKTPNESIDSWTDLLVNEVQDLDGKYGPINSVINHDDELFTFQDEAVAQIAVNPRVQVQGTDGLSLELGKGSLLYDYKYLTTKSGSLNKWSTLSTKQGFYYYDALNKSVFKYPDYIKVALSDAKGYHSFFNNNYIYSDIAVDNPVKNQGVVLGYDNYNHDVYITALQGDKTFTRCYNELQQQFIDLKTYHPSWYINKGESLFITNSTDNEVYEQYAGEYNKFFGEYQPSYITLLVNPSVPLDTLFTNIFYRSEMYLDDIDQPDKTLTHIQAYNEYQDSGRVPLILGRSSNLRRKFRDWKADIPRQANTRNKLRNPWIFLKLELDNESNYKMILHDIIVQYNNYK